MKFIKGIFSGISSIWGNILFIGMFILSVFSFGYLKGKNNEKNKEQARNLDVLKQAKSTRESVKKIPANKLNDRLNKLLND